jgi:hypothetical protein
MRKSIVLMTLAALTAGLATGCASSGEMSARPPIAHVQCDYVMRRPLECDYVVRQPLETAILVPPKVEVTPQRARATVALSRPTLLAR